MKNNIQLLLDLYWTFFKIGISTFGGGYAMLPLLSREIVDNKKWASNDEILNYYALGQCTPGIIAVNTSTFIGYKIKGIIGAIFATFGFISPSLLIILLIANLIDSFAHLSILQHAFSGIRLAVCALIILTLIKLIKSNLNNYIKIIIAILSMISIVCFNISPVLITIIAFILGLVFMREK